LIIAQIAQDAVADPNSLKALAAFAGTLTTAVAGGGYFLHRKVKNGGGGNTDAMRATQEAHTKLLEDRRLQEVKIFEKLDDIKDGIGGVAISVAELSANVKNTDKRLERLEDRQ